MFHRKSSHLNNLYTHLKKEKKLLNFSKLKTYFRKRFILTIIMTDYFDYDEGINK